MASSQNPIFPLSLAILRAHRARPMTISALFYRPTATPDRCPSFVAYPLLSVIHKTEALAGSNLPRKLWPYRAISKAITEINHDSQILPTGEKMAVTKPRSLVY